MLQIDNKFEIVKINVDTNEWKVLYEGIPSLEEAYLLAQDAMFRTYQDIILITPGNRQDDILSVNKDWLNSLKEKYKAEEW